MADLERYLRSVEEVDRQVMRETYALAYSLKWDFNPEILRAAADQIDCGGECDTVWREHDTNAAGCTKSETQEGCPFEIAHNLREMATAICNQHWLLAFAPGAWTDG